MRFVTTFDDVQKTDQLRMKLFELECNLMQTDFFGRKYWKQEVYKWITRHPDSYLLLTSPFNLTLQQLQGAISMLEELKEEFCLNADEEDRLKELF